MKKSISAYLQLYFYLVLYLVVPLPPLQLVCFCLALAARLLQAYDDCDEPIKMMLDYTNYYESNY